ncbi:hypothetical protein FHX15_006344 [Rhizobium sp. BK650]|nr:hypothetical protein [Rhizobium sp. BK650]
MYLTATDFCSCRIAEETAVGAEGFEGSSQQAAVDDRGWVENDRVGDCYGNNERCSLQPAILRSPH